MTFKELQLHPDIQKAIDEEGYTQPTPIQQQAIVPVLEGHDLVACAQTGTGKTAAFSIPILEKLHRDFDEKHSKVKHITALIVTPTRELAIQIEESIKTYGKYTGVRSEVIFGGVNQTSQVNSLKRGVDILVATPGRLLDLHQQKLVNISQIKQLVLDEADQMLDMGFIHDIKKIIKLIPQKRQTLLFSATMPVAIQELAMSILHKPKHISVTPISSTAEKVEQKVYFVSKQNKRPLLVHLIKDNQLENVLVFTRTKHGADNVVRYLSKNQISAAAIHGDKSQNQRVKALEGFKTKQINILVATDIAARGIDIEQLPFVINYDIPNISETYVHRIGRTGRAGNSGLAISFCDTEEVPYLKDIEKLIKLKIPEVKEHPYLPSNEVSTELKKPDLRNKKKPEIKKLVQTSGGNPSKKSKFNFRHKKRDQ